MTNLDTEAAIKILKKYERQFAEIIELIGNKSELVEPEKSRARELLQVLKEDLARDCSELKQRDSQGTLNRIERTHLEPALRKAKVNIITRVNSTPGSDWRFDLNGAVVDITWTLHNLENPK